MKTIIDMFLLGIKYLPRLTTGLFPYKSHRAAISQLAKSIGEDSSFVPNIIFSPNHRGAHIASAIVEKNKWYDVMVVTGICDKYDRMTLDSGLYDELPSPNKWAGGVFAPSWIKAGNKQKKILFVDDWMDTGQTWSSFKAWCIGKGFKEDAVKAATLYVSRTSLKNNLQGHYFVKQINDPRQIKLPWGDLY